LTRLLVASAALGALLAGTLAWSLRGSVAEAAPLPPAPPERPADIWGSVAEGCVRAGGSWWMGTEDGVVVARCRPELPNLGVGPAVARRPR
jgi:hypothetical protein